MAPKRVHDPEERARLARLAPVSRPPRGLRRLEVQQLGPVRFDGDEDHLLVQGANARASQSSKSWAGINLRFASTEMSGTPSTVSVRAVPRISSTRGAKFRGVGMGERPPGGSASAPGTNTAPAGCPRRRSPHRSTPTRSETPAANRRCADVREAGTGDRLPQQIPRDGVASTSATLMAVATTFLSTPRGRGSGTPGSAAATHRHACTKTRIPPVRVPRRRDQRLFPRSHSKRTRGGNRDLTHPGDHDEHTAPPGDARGDLRSARRCSPSHRRIRRQLLGLGPVQPPRRRRSKSCCSSSCVPRQALLVAVPVVVGSLAGSRSAR